MFVIEHFEILIQSVAAAAVFLRTSTSNTLTFYGKIETKNKFCIRTLKELKGPNDITFKPNRKVTDYYSCCLTPLP